MSTPLKLRAVDADDLEVLGACLQDALVPVQDMQFLGAENRFVMLANRFCWEKLAPEAREDSGGSARTNSYERVHCGITFEHVKSVAARGFSPGTSADRGRLLEVLTFLAEDGILTVVFSGGAAVRLHVGEVEAFVQDMGEPWPTMWRPYHPVEDELDPDGGTR
jgi:hypothetical protein